MEVVRFGCGGRREQTEARYRISAGPGFVFPAEAVRCTRGA